MPGCRRISQHTSGRGARRVRRARRAVCAEPVAAVNDRREDRGRSEGVDSQHQWRGERGRSGSAAGGRQDCHEIVGEAFAIDRFTVVLFTSFGVLGLLLAAVGIYGVMAFAVGQRTHEFGIRMALGAQQSRVLNLVLKEGVILATSGMVIGLSGAYLVGRAMHSTLYGVGAFDAYAFSGVALLLLFAALLASFVPAWRASRVEPLEALRYE